MMRTFFLAALVALPIGWLTACQDYESPGAVADESVWSHVPAGSKDQNLPARDERQREVAELEERIANLDYRLDQLGKGDKGAASSQTLAATRSTLQAVKADIAQLRSLYDQPEAFRELRDDVTNQIADLQSRVDELGEES